MTRPEVASCALLCSEHQAEWVRYRHRDWSWCRLRPMLSTLQVRKQPAASEEVMLMRLVMVRSCEGVVCVRSEKVEYGARSHARASFAARKLLARCKPTPLSQLHAFRRGLVSCDFLSRNQKIVESLYYGRRCLKA